jgi:hypothetical protein
MSNANTDSLYKQFRAATLKRDEAKAISILQQIVAISPGDQKAIKLLAEMKAAQKQNPAPNQKKASLTRELYGKYRQACLSHNDIRAFEILEEIVRIDPADNDAEQQKQNLGKRIAEELAPTLAEVLQSGDIERISSAVEKIKKYAREEYLQTLPDYSAAAAIHRQHEQKEVLAHIHSQMEELKKLSDTEQRHRKALAIEKHAANHLVPIPQEYVTIIEDIHHKWELHCVHLEQQEQFEQLYAEFLTLQAKIKDKQDLAVCKEKLSNLRGEIQQLDTVEEAELLDKKIEKYQTRVNNIIQAGIRKARLLKVSAYLTISILVAAGAAVSYAYSTANVRCEEFAAALQNHNTQAAQVLMKRAYPMAHLYRLISASYAELLTRTQKWLVEYKLACNKEKEYKNWLEKNIGNSTVQQAEELIHHVAEGELVFKELENKFNHAVPDDLKLKHLKFKHELNAGLKQKIISTFAAVTPETSLDKLTKLYEEYLKLLTIVEISKEEDQRVVQLVHEKALLILSRYTDDIDRAQEALQLFDRYSSRLELPGEVRQILEQRLQHARTFDKLPSLLANCSTISDYIEILKKCEYKLQEIPQAISIKELTDLQSKIPELVFRHKLKQYTNQEANFSMNDWQRLMAELSRIYSSGAGSLFREFNETEFNRIIDLMTLPEKGPQWSDDYQQSISNGMVYVVGKVYKIQDDTIIRPVDMNGKLGEKVPLHAPFVIHPLQLSDFRSSTGFNRKMLQQGRVLPTILMRNVVNATDRKYPVMMRAWFYSLAIDLLNCVESKYSGLIFSPTLQNDIKKFGKLKNRIINDNWFKPHPVAQENEILAYFNLVKTHNYAHEIIQNINYINDTKCILAGYINSRGHFVPIGSRQTHTLLIYENGTLVEYVNKYPKPYTPVFAIPNR